MRRSEDELIDPEVAAALDAIDATLAGEAVDPRHADMAELALLLAAGRPELDEDFARELDARVTDGFGGSARPASRRTGFSWPSLPVLGSALAAGVAAVVAVVALGSGGLGPSGGLGAPGGSGGTKRLTAPVAKRPATTSSASAQVPAAAPASGAASNAQSTGPAQARLDALRAAAVSRVVTGSTVTTASSSSSPSFNPAALVPTSNGRKIVQSAQLALTTGPSHVDDVAQEIFNVVGTEHGIVSRSNVTATGGPDGYAHFELSLPSASLPDAMSRLSRLRYASVSSRTDSTQDVNGSFVSAGRRLADAQALRTALLKQLAGATTTNQIASLHAQIRDAENSIAQAQADLRSLGHRVNFSSVSVTVAASQPAPVAHSHGSSGFTLHRALHDAGRVLTVAAGVALITLAVLVPVALLGLLVWWITVALRRRRREHALDLA
jgi:hypothetical protein